MYKNIKVNDEIMDVPSVSQIVGIIDKSDALLPWSARMAVEYISNHRDELFDSAHSFDNICQSAVYAYKDISKDACSTGTDIHDQVERYIKTGEEFDNVSFKAFLDFVNFYNVEFIESEIFLLSSKHYYAGTCDIIANVNGKKIIIDIKTSKAIYSDYQYQLAAYSMAYEEMSGEILPTAVLRLDKEVQDYEFKMFKNNSQSKIAFLSLLGFYYHAKKRRLKNNKRIEMIWR